MKGYRTFLLVCLLSSPAFALDVTAPGPGWLESQRTDELVVFYRDDPAQSGREVLAVAEADAPPATLFSVVTDYEHYTSFMPYMKEARVLARVGTTEVFVYERLSFPVISDRDLVVHVHLDAGTSRDGVFRTRWTAEPGHEPVHDGIVRVPLTTGSWTLEPIDGGKRTRVTYRVLASPGGWIPKWAAEGSTTRAVPKLFQAVKARAASLAGQTR